jgi:hypothetical protein
MSVDFKAIFESDKSLVIAPQWVSRDSEGLEVVAPLLIDGVAVEGLHRIGGSYIRTPVMYPSGSSVVVRIEQGSDRFFVSDVGLGQQEADLMGAGPMYSKHARAIAELAGVRFDNQAFFVLEASRDQPAGAVATIANCSQEAAMRASDALAEKTFEDKKLRLYERLVSIFDPKIVTKNVDIIGASTQKWNVAAIVKIGSRATIFEPVTKHPNSVASASMKFGNIKLIEGAPQRVAVVPDLSELGTLLTVLQRSASVIEDNAPTDRIVTLAKAA